MFEKEPIRKSFRHLPPLETERLFLKKLTLRYAGDFYEYAKDPETSKYLLWSPHPSRRYTAQYVLYLQRQYARGKFFDWAVIEKESGKMIGTCGFTEIYEKEKRCEVGYVFSPAFHRRHFAPEALQCVLTYGFSVLGLQKASARFMEDNEASRKVAERMGFRDDTQKLEYFAKNGKLQRIITYSIDRNEFFRLFPPENS